MFFKERERDLERLFFIINYEMKCYLKFKFFLVVCYREENGEKYKVGEIFIM